MRHKVISVVLVCLVFSAVASPELGAAPRPLEVDGALYLYLEPFVAEATQLDFRILELEARNAAGETFTLPIFLREIRGAEQLRQRALSSSVLPPGQYSGLSMTIGAASLESQGEKIALPPPSEPISITVPFRVDRKQATVLSLTLDPRASVRGTDLFTPVFRSQTPPRPASGLLALVSNREANTVTLFDKVSGRVVGVIPTGREPSAIALDSRRSRAYVALPGDDTVLEIGLLEFRSLSTLRLRGGDQPVGLALTPDGATLLAADHGSRTLSFIDPLSMVETDRITVGDQPEAVLMDGAGQRAYVFNTGSATITAIDVSRRSLVGTIATDPGPFWGQLDRLGGSLYVAHRHSPYVSVVDPETLVVRNKVYVGPRVTALKVNPQTDYLYLSRQGSGEIEIFDPFSLLPIDSISVDATPSFLSFDGEQNALFVVLAELREVRSIEVVGKSTKTRTAVDAAPFWLALTGD